MFLKILARNECESSHRTYLLTALGGAYIKQRQDRSKLKQSHKKEEVKVFCTPWHPEY